MTDLKSFLEARLSAIPHTKKAIVIERNNAGLPSCIHIGMRSQSAAENLISTYFNLSPSGVMEIRGFHAQGTMKSAGYAPLLLAAIHDAACLSPQGLRRIDLTASRDNGVSFWSRLGFFPTLESQFEHIKKALLKELEANHDAFSPLAYARLHQLLTSDDPRSLCTISRADISTTDGRCAQEVLKLRNNNNLYFYGELDVNDCHYSQIFVPALQKYLTQTPFSLAIQPQNKLSARP